MELHEKEAFLRSLPRLTKWPERDVRWLAASVTDFVLEKDQLVFAQSPESDDAFIVVNGRVRQFIADKTGEEWWYRTCTAGHALMQERLFRGEGHATQAVAEARSTLLRVHASVLTEALTRHPDLWDLLTSSNAFRLQGIPLLRVLDDDQIEILAVSSESREFKKGDTICNKDEEPGRLWIVDWGQVRITDRGAVGYNSGGVVTVYESRGGSARPPASEPSILTAGNYFCGGKLGIWNLPGLETVSAVAETNVKLLSISQPVVERLASRVPDVAQQLAQRFDLRARLKEALGGHSLFAGLKDSHWDELLTVAGWEHVPADLDVVAQGQDGGKLYILTVGAARVFRRDEAGREMPQYVLRRGINDVFGVTPMLENSPYQATVRSIRSTLEGGPADGLDLDGSDWLTLQRDDLLFLIQSHRERWAETALGKALLKGPADKEFDWLKHGEDVVLLTRRHVLWLWIRVAAAFLLAYAVVALVGLVDWILPASFQTLSYVLVLLLVLVPLLIWYLVDYYNDYFVITTRRVARRDQVLFISESRVEAMMERVQDISLRTYLLGRIFDYADLSVRTAGTGGVILFNMVPSPDKVEATIVAQQRARKAHALAEERENLRSMMLNKLRLRLIPSYPARALPAGTQQPEHIGPLRALVRRILSPVRRFFRWIRRLPETIYVALLHLLPRRSRERILKDRAESKKREAASNQDQVVYRKHIWFLIRAAAIPLATLIITGFLVLLPGQVLRDLNLPRFVQIPLVVWVLICIFWMWFRIENWRNDKYILSRTHLIDITALPLGLFEERKQAEWDKVQNASFKIPNFWANLLDFGTVVVETASTYGNFDFMHIPHPAAVQQEIFLHMEIARQAAEDKARAAQQSVQLEALELYHHHQTGQS